MTHATYADLLQPDEKHQALAYDLLLILGISLLIGLSAQVAIPLPFSPVPITGQTLMVLLAGATLGSKRGSLCLLAYLTEGLTGLPVFAAGASGLSQLLGPTGGYLVGFVVAAYFTGRLAEQGWDRRISTTALAMLFGNAVIYAFGVTWLMAFVGLKQAIAVGFYPFIIGDVLKLMIAALALPFGWKLLSHLHFRR
jgi:biotin transport system substrate-specific component